jgi:transposase
MGEVSTIGLDIAKSVFQIHGVNAAGAVVIRKRITRAEAVGVLRGTVAVASSALRPVRPHIIGAANFKRLGHTVRLLPPSYVKAYLNRSKNDANDAAAICEGGHAAVDAICGDEV